MALDQAKLLCLLLALDASDLAEAIGGAPCLAIGAIIATSRIQPATVIILGQVQLSTPANSGDKVDRGRDLGGGGFVCHRMWEGQHPRQMMCHLSSLKSKSFQPVPSPVPGGLPFPQPDHLAQPGGLGRFPCFAGLPKPFG